MKVPPSESWDRILWPVRRGRSGGMTLIELMIAVGIMAVVIGVVGFLSLGTWRTYLISSTYTDVEGLARLAMDWMVKDIRAATQIYASATIGGSPYSTSSDELVLWKGSDYVVYYRSADGSQLYRLVDTGGNGSADVTKLIASYISNLNFEDGEESPGTNPTSDTDLVDLSVTVSKTRFGGARSKTLTSAARLRNR